MAESGLRAGRKACSTERGLFYIKVIFAVERWPRLSIEAKSIVSARKKAKDIAEDCIYGYMDLLEVELKEERQ